MPLGMTQDRAADPANACLFHLGETLASQLRFLREADKLKTVIRGNRIADASRRENAAEHSWHIALFALVLARHTAEPVDPLRVVSMLLLQDLVEIDCGDTPLFDEVGAASQAERECGAADRLFGLLPAAQAAEYRQLWDEFEAAATADARFAKAIDRLQPIILNHSVGGGTWIDYGVDEERERLHTSRIADGSSVLWAAAEVLIQDAVRQGWLKPAPAAR
jgi:putative hydrolases of HD superfamily